MAEVKNSRDVAFEVLEAVELDGAYANLVMPKAARFARLDTRDAAMAQELAYGSLRSRTLYEHVIEVGSKRSISEVDPLARIVLLIGIHQLLAMRVPAHAALSETVNLAKRKLKPSAAGFVNGVLRRAAEHDRDFWLRDLLRGKSSEASKLAGEFSHPEWIVKALDQSLALDGRSGELRDLLALDNTPAEVNVAALPGFCASDEMLSAGLKIGFASPIGYELSSGNPAEIRAIAEGRARVQDQGSQLVALAVAASTKVAPNEQWLDLCAGPGGKAALLAALAKQSGATLTCNEIAPHRAELVEQALSPINPQVFVRVGDGRDLGEDAPESFDRILIDAPCTGLGALRRRPEARWRKQNSDLADLVPLQKELLKSAWMGLKPGGVMVYSTCSPHVSETVAVVDWAMKEFVDAEIIDAQETLRSINPGLDFKTKRKTAQLWPQAHGTDAMFMAILRKPIG